jgi:hypothetical protein
MIPDKIVSALKIIYVKLHNKDILWILSGSTSLAIQGVDIKINNDIDILTDKKGSKEIDKLLEEFRIKTPEYTTTDKYKSFYGIYQINNIKVEVMGEFQYRLNTSLWSRPNQTNEILIKKFKNMNILVLKLSQELQEYEAMDKKETIKSIKASLK